MKRFAPALRRLAQELDVAPPVRNAILLELAADLESAFEHHVRRGATDSDAAAQAELLVLGSPDVARRLASVHRGRRSGWPEGIGARLGRGVDLLVLIVGVLPVLAFSAGVAARTLTASPSPLVWSLLLVGAALSVAIAVEAGRILGGGRGSTASLSWLPALGALAAALGLLAATTTGWSAARYLVAAGVTDDTTLVALTQVGVAGALLLLGLLLAVAAMLSWFVLATRAAARARREVEAILTDDAPPAPPHGGDVVPLVPRRRA
jgi:hypothetical protein